jgi:HEPN domain-containing protein
MAGNFMDESTLELVRDWLTRAEHDLRSARALAALADPLRDTAIYHCQQAAEKSMKAWLQSKDDPFPKTHDIGLLVKQAAKLNPGFSQFEKAASVLTPYVSAFRYPGGSDEPMPTRAEFDEALQHAQAIYDFVKEQLPV